MAPLAPLLLCAAPAAAQTIVLATGGTQPELQAAADSLGTEGGVVLVPIGEWEMVGTLTIAADDVTLIGAGPARTRLYHSTDDATPYLRADDVARTRVTGLRIDGATSAASTALEVGVRLQDAVDFRVDHCALTFLGNSGVMSRGTSRGVVDHCQILDLFKPAIANYGYGVSIYGTAEYSGLPYGTPEATYIEDNFIRGTRHAAASNSGARYVFRYNHVTGNENSHGVDAHGDEYNDPSNAGTEWIEVYENLIDDPVQTSAAVRIRGGEGVVWNNEVYGYLRGVSLWENTPQPTGPVYIWGNTWGPGVTGVGDLQGSPVYHTTALAGYSSYAYPHPLVTDLDAQAGPDSVSVVGTGGSALVYVDASASAASTGSVSGYHWLENGQTELSSCARDVLELGEGAHLVLLQVERDDGLREHDSVVLDVVPDGPLASSPSWAERWFVPLVTTGSVSFELAITASPQDAYVALTGRHAVADHPDAAMIVRTAPSGAFDVRNGDAYGADVDIPYAAGQSVAVVVDFDLAAQTYDVAIDGVPLAQGYAFRHAETAIGQLVAWHASGGLSVSELSLSGEQAQPDEPCRPEPPPDGGAGGSGAGSGAGASSGGSGGLGAGGATSVPGANDSAESGGCGCALPGRARGAGSLLGLLATLVGGWLGRRSRTPRTAGASSCAGGACATGSAAR